MDARVLERAVELIKSRLMAISLALCLTLGSLSAQRDPWIFHFQDSLERYQIGESSGWLTLERRGILTWPRPEPQPTYQSPAPFDLSWSMTPFGSDSRFLISGYDRKSQVGKIALIELQENPDAIQTLSVMDYDVRPFSIAYNPLTSELFVYDPRRSTIEMAVLPASLSTLPQRSAFTEIIKFPPDSQFYGRWEMRVEFMSMDSNSGVYFCEQEESWTIHPIPKPIHPIQKKGEEWRVIIIPELLSWETDILYTPSQGPLIAVVAGMNYAVKRADLEGGPVTVSTGSFADNPAAIGKMGQLAIPPEGLVPGADYYVDAIENEHGAQPDALVGSSFTPLWRSGLPTANRSIESGQGFTSGYSAFGNDDFHVAVFVEWVDEPRKKQELDLFLFWSLANADGSHPVTGVGEVAILSNHLGVLRRRIGMGEREFPIRYLGVPLTDPRLKVGELVYFQWVLKVDNATTVVSDVFATTIFPPKASGKKDAQLDIGTDEQPMGSRTPETEKVLRLALETLKRAK